MSDQQLQQALTPLKQRLQWRSSLKAFWITVSAGLILSCLLLAVGRVLPLFFQWQLLIIGLLSTAVLLLLGQFYAWFKPLTLAQLARLGDAYLRLEARLTTAFELAEGTLETSAALRQAQFDDTLKYLRGTSLSTLVPVMRPKQLARGTGLVLVLSAIVVALFLWPNPQDAVIQQQADLEELLETEIAELEEIQAELLAEADVLGETQVEELSDTLQELIERLERAQNEGSPEQALAALSEAGQTLDSFNETRREQEQAFNNLADLLSASDSEAAREAGEALQRGAFAEAAQAFRQAGENPPASQQQTAALADTLRQAAADLGATNPDLAQSLQQSAAALQSGDPQAVQEALDRAARQLNEASEQLAGQQQLAQTLENIQQARQELAQQQGGQGQAADQGQGIGVGQGAVENRAQGGSGREDPGGDVPEGVEAEEGVPGSMSTANGPNQNRLEDYDSVYAPTHLGGEGGPLAVPDPQGSDSSGIDIGETAPNPNREAGEVTVPYSEVFGEYRDQASTALDNEHIPLGMRDYIRQYFGALEPGD